MIFDFDFNSIFFFFYIKFGLVDLPMIQSDLKNIDFFEESSTHNFSRLVYTFAYKFEEKLTRLMNIKFVLLNQ